MAFYHNLIGDSDMAGDRARLLKNAGFRRRPAARNGHLVGNAGAIIGSNQGRINVVVPANGFVVLVKQ